MCLIVFAYNYHPDYKLILTANRDEFFPRPTRAMQFWPEQPELLAGQDLEQGGTWLGMNRNGRFSALTNHRNGRIKAQGKQSRGFLALDFINSNLSCTDFIKATELPAYDGFNQLIDDGHSLYYLSNRSEHPARIQPGIHGLSNALLNTPWPKSDSRKSALKQVIDSGEINAEQLIQLMANKDQYPDHLLPDTGISQDWERKLSSSFIQMENYGTRATTVILQKYDGQTEILEQNYDYSGAIERKRFMLQLPASSA